MTQKTISGEVITFYSYKGGTGRTMALANVACILADKLKGQKILMIDWDLEAPGLHRFFNGRTESQLSEKPSFVFDENPGLIDLFGEIEETINEYETEETSNRVVEKIFDKIRIEDYTVETDIPNLFLLKAGRFDEFYSTRVNTFAWETLFNKIPALFRIFADELSKHYRYVLIDSRTGFNDISNICTMLMPETLVVVFTPNRQSLTGVIELIKNATEYRKQSEDLRPMNIFPLPSRIETTRPSLHEEWRFGNREKNISGYQPQFEETLKEIYDLPQCDLKTYFDEVQIQHVPEYAYGEEIAVLEERGDSRLSLARSYRNFTERLLDLPRPWWQSETIAAKVYISYKHTEPDKSLANSLEKHLSQLGHTVFLDTKIAVGAKWAEEIERMIKSADVFIIILSESSIRSEMIMTEAQLAHKFSQAATKRKKTIMPIHVNFQGELPHDLGAYLAPYQYASWDEGDSYEAIGNRVAASISKFVNSATLYIDVAN